MQKNDFFDGIKQSAVKIGSRSVPFPFFYRDLAYVGVFLLAPLDTVTSILPSKRMHPFRLTPWHCLVTITASEYKDSDIGPYNAVSIGVPFVLDKAAPVFTGILRKPPEVPMIYLLHLPVTTEIARDTGVAVANFPESLADIGFESDMTRGSSATSTRKERIFCACRPESWISALFPGNACTPLLCSRIVCCGQN